LHVIPAKAGIQWWNASRFNYHLARDPGFRRGDAIPFLSMGASHRIGGQSLSAAMPARLSRRLRVACAVFCVYLAAPPSAVAAEQMGEGRAAAQFAREARQQGRYAESVRLGRQALALSEQAQGLNHPDTLGALLDLSEALRDNGEPSEALQTAQRAVDSDSSDPATTARALYVLGEAYRAKGKCSDGIAPAQQAHTAREKILGKEHPDTAASLHSLAELYSCSGDYPKALPLAQRALDIREKTLGKDDPAVGESLNDLGLLYFSLRDDEKAGSLYQRALILREKVLGPDHPRTAETVNNLGALHWRQKDLTQALALFERALLSKEKVLGAEHPAVATALNNLAEAYRAQRDYRRALPLAQRAAAVTEKRLGPNHPNTAAALHNVAGFYWTQGDLARAEPLLQRASRIWESTMGAQHPDTARSLNLLAAFYRSRGDYKQALALYRRGLAAEDLTLASIFAVTSEDQKLQFLEKTQGHYLAALSLLQQRFLSDPEAVRFGLELVLRRKGIVLDAQARTRDTIAGHLQSDTRQEWEGLIADRIELARLLLGGPGEEDPQRYRNAIEELQAKIDATERSLSARSELMARERRQREVTAELLASHLPPDGVLVELVQIRDWEEKQLVWSSRSRYLAFILTADNRVALVDLGDTETTNAEVKAALTASNDPDFLQDLKSYTRRTDDALAQLYKRLIEPLKPHIPARGHLIVSPDGELNGVPFAALRTAEARYLVEDRPISYVASGRDLMRGKSGVDSTVAMVLIANPAFDDRGSLRAGVFRTRPAVRASDYEKVAYPPLPGTAAEAEAIAPFVKGVKQIYQGKQATESAARNAKSPRILHLATHGFFLADPSQALAPDPLGRGRRGLYRSGPEGPLVRSGLALAGANHADEIATGDDGILTALEVTGMDLYGTDLAVLSACETALGEIRVGEGVFGLRRAFVLAGARNLLISLWPVSDKITQDMMMRFYASYGEGKPLADALADAQVATIAHLRQVTSAGAQREAYAPVKLWAPFILQETN